MITKLDEFRKMNEGTEFNYMMLDRLRADCEYFLGNGKGSVNALHQGSVDGQIAEMKKIWNALKEKPEWLSMEQIVDYENKMKNYMITKLDEFKAIKENMSGAATASHWSELMSHIKSMSGFGKMPDAKVMWMDLVDDTNNAGGHHDIKVIFANRGSHIDWNWTWGATLVDEKDPEQMKGVMDMANRANDEEIKFKIGEEPGSYIPKICERILEVEAQRLSELEAENAKNQ